MAWLYEKSPTWRKIVKFTAQSPLYMAGFAVAAIGIPVYFGDKVMETTNSPGVETALEKELLTRASVDSKMLARAQKERLQVLLDELKGGGGEARYRAALDGRSLGTHSTGTTVGATAIKREL